MKKIYLTTLTIGFLSSFSITTDDVSNKGIQEG